MRDGVMIAIALIGFALASHAGQSPAAHLRITQRDLVPLCLNGQPVQEGTRSWDARPGPITLAVTMRVLPRPGRTATVPGTATISFTAEAGHRYEAEVRAEPTAFSSRAWTAGQWTPVIRDRTTDRIVSGDADWRGDGGCPDARQPSSASSRVTSPSS
jgi:hypothetical protein